jgi:hypothetical protein
MRYFRNGFFRHKGFPDTCKGFDIIDETYPLTALAHLQQIEAINRIIALPELEDLNLSAGLDRLVSSVCRFVV